MARTFMLTQKVRWRPLHTTIKSLTLVAAHLLREDYHHTQCRVPEESLLDAFPLSTCESGLLFVSCYFSFVYRRPIRAGCGKTAHARRQLSDRRRTPPAEPQAHGARDRQ